MADVSDDEEEVELRHARSPAPPTSPTSAARPSLLHRSSRAGGGAGRRSDRCCGGAQSVVGRQRWARCALTVLRLSYVFVFCVAAAALYELAARRADGETTVLVVGGIAVSLALPLSLFDVHAHLSAMVSPLQIRCVCGWLGCLCDLAPL
jgi:hypothetical protein